MPLPAISVIIPALNEERRLGPTVREAVTFLRARGGTFEILVVDDGSRDGTSALVRRLAEDAPEVRLIRLGLGHGRCRISRGR